MHHCMCCNREKNNYFVPEFNPESQTHDTCTLRTLQKSSMKVGQDCDLQKLHQS